MQAILLRASHENVEHMAPLLLPLLWGVFSTVRSNLLTLFPMIDRTEGMAVFAVGVNKIFPPTYVAPHTADS